jgi:organic radical activating enzyme
MVIFKYLDLELSSSCNRTCPGCIRNSHPQRQKLKSWFKPNYMPIETIKEALEQCVKMNFPGEVCLSHYNEPLMDERLPEIAALVHSYGFSTFLNTNGDFITPELAKKLDGHLDKIIVSLYMGEPVKSRRKKWIETLFHQTEMVVNTMSDHIATHFSPIFDVKSLAEQHLDNPCTDPRLHCIINHRGQYLLCCDDVIGNFDLGKFPDIGIEDYWFGEKHKTILENLISAGRRRLYDYCSTCPRQ